MKRKWTQGLITAALLVSMVAADLAPLTAYAEEADDGTPAVEEVTEADNAEEPDEEEPDEQEEAYPEVSEGVLANELDEETEEKDENQPVTFAVDGEDEEPEEETIDEPTLKKVSIEDGQITVTWNAVSNATKYDVYRRTSSSSSWTKMGTATSTSYTDKKSLSYNTQYYYTVQAYNDNVQSTKGTHEISAVYYKAPSSLTLNVTTNGIKLTWTKVKGATGYGIYRMAANESSYTLVNMVNSPDTLVYRDRDSSLKSGTTYYYRVQAYVGSSASAKANPKNGQYWGMSVTGKKCVYLTTPILKSATVAASGTKVSWKTVTGASGYAVYRKKGSSGSWKRIAMTTSTSYTDKESLSAGTTYYYTIRAYKGSQKTALNNQFSPKYWSYRDSTGVKSVYLKKPSMNSVYLTSTGVKVKWSSVSKASGYGVFRKQGSSGSWELIGTTTKTTYTDKSSLTKDKTYYYTVRAYKGTKSKAKANTTSAAYWGLYNSTGLSYSTATGAAKMDSKAQSYSSSTKYLILVNCTTNKLAIYTGKKGNWTRKYLWDCTTGKKSTPTKKGQYTVGSKGKSFGGKNYTCWYYTQWSGNYLFHSVLYKKGSMTQFYDSELGANKSHGCVRLAIDNAKWIYNNIPRGTKVVTY